MWVEVLVYVFLDVRKYISHMYKDASKCPADFFVHYIVNIRFCVTVLASRMS